MAKQTFTTGQVLTAAQMTSLQQTAMGGGSATAKTASYTLVAADAGATVIMNSASATTITVNTSLFSAGDTVFIQNIGAGVCTITAGTATVNTASSLALAQYESGNLYFTAAAASIFSKADGAAAAGGGMTLLSTTTLSGASTTISTINQTYKNLFVVLSDVANSATFQLRMEVNSSHSLSYGRVMQSPGSSGTNTTVASADLAGVARFLLTANTDNAAGDIFSGTVDIISYSSTSGVRKKINSNLTTFQNGNYTGQFGSFVYYSTSTAISSLTFSPNTGTFSGGTVLVYGVK